MGHEEVDTWQLAMILWMNLQSVPFPQNDTNAWIWVAGAMVFGIVGMAVTVRSIFNKYDEVREKSQTRAENQVDKILPTLEANTKSVNDMTSAQQGFKQFLGDLVAQVANIAKAQEVLANDHKYLRDAVDEIKRNQDRILRDMEVTTDDRPPTRRSR